MINFVCLSETATLTDFFKTTLQSISLGKWLTLLEEHLVWSRRRHRYRTSLFSLHCHFWLLQFSIDSRPGAGAGCCQSRWYTLAGEEQWLVLVTPFADVAWPWTVICIAIAMFDIYIPHPQAVKNASNLSFAGKVSIRSPYHESAQQSILSVKLLLYPKERETLWLWRAFIYKINIIHKI